MRYRKSVLALKKRIRKLEESVAAQPRDVGHSIALRNQIRKYRMYLAQRGRCVFCERMMYADSEGNPKKEIATIEHIVCRSAGGSDREDNVCLSCWECNNLREDRKFERFMKLRRAGEIKPRGLTKRERVQLRKEKRNREKAEQYQTDPAYRAKVDAYLAQNPHHLRTHPYISC